jgi:hypothetical protein
VIVVLASMMELPVPVVTSADRPGPPESVTVASRRESLRSATDATHIASPPPTIVAFLIVRSRVETITRPDDCETVCPAPSTVKVPEAGPYDNGLEVRSIGPTVMVMTLSPGLASAAATASRNLHVSGAGTTGQFPGTPIAASAALFTVNVVPAAPAGSAPLIRTLGATIKLAKPKKRAIAVTLIMHNLPGRCRPQIRTPLGITDRTTNAAQVTEEKVPKKSSRTLGFSAHRSSYWQVVFANAHQSGQSALPDEAAAGNRAVRTYVPFGARCRRDSARVVSRRSVR